MEAAERTLAQDLPCELMPSGDAIILTRGTVIESERGPLIAPSGDFYLLQARGATYRARARPVYE